MRVHVCVMCTCVLACACGGGAGVLWILLAFFRHTNEENSVRHRPAQRVENDKNIFVSFLCNTCGVALVCRLKKV